MSREIPVTKIPVIIEHYDRPVLFLGAPGIGKTALIAETAAMLAKKQNKILVDLVGEAAEPARILGVQYVKPRGQRELVKLYEKVSERPEDYFVFLRIVATQITPEDLQYPRLHGEAVIAVPPVMLSFLTIDGVSGILFIDEITNIRRDDVKTMLFAMINERRLGLSGRISDGVKIVAAGNTEEHSSVAEPLPAPLANRFAIIKVRPPSAEEWVEYMLHTYGKAVDDVVIAYILANGDKVLYVKPRDVEGYENFPTPRTWHAVAIEARKLAEVDEEAYEALVIGLLGEKVGSEFLAFRKLQPPKPEEMLEDPTRFVNLKLETRVLAAVMIARYTADLVEKGKKGKVIAKMVRFFDEVLSRDPSALEQLSIIVRLWKAMLGRVQGLLLAADILAKMKTPAVERLKVILKRLKEIESALPL